MAAEFIQETQRNRFLTVQVSDTNYALEIQYVRQIIGIMPLTKVPNNMPFMEGVLNYNGDVFPVIDLRKRFKHDIKEYDEKSCTIVLEVDNKKVGIIVERVSEVVMIMPKDIQKTNDDNYINRFLSGVSTSASSIKILNIFKILDFELI